MAKKGQQPETQEPKAESSGDVADAPESAVAQAHAEAVAAMDAALSTPVPTAPAEPVLNLQDVARRLCEGYKEHWWPSIKKHAETHGFAGLRGTEAACRAELTRWGAKLKG